MNTTKWNVIPTGATHRTHTLVPLYYKMESGVLMVWLDHWREAVYANFEHLSHEHTVTSLNVEGVV